MFHIYRAVFILVASQATYISVILDTADTFRASDTLSNLAIVTVDPVREPITEIGFRFIAALAS